MDATVLSDLCGICYVEKPKYRCPRCKTQTCSLPCYKRHQQRASCSGKRDPAVYVKKSKWATPNGIDHDYNYLKGIERSIDDAGHDSKCRGIGVESHASKSAARASKPDSALQRYLIRNHIDVSHAPKGMSRQKTNSSRMTKGGHVVWTVEWAGASGNHDIQNNCLESKSIAELHSIWLTEKRNAEKQKNKYQRRGVKRKYERDHGKIMSPSMAKIDKQQDDIASIGPPNESYEALAADEMAQEHQTCAEASSSLANESDRAHELQPTQTATTNRHMSEDVAGRKDGDVEDDSSDDVTSDVEIVVDRDDPSESPLRFYLLKAATTSTYRVLIPLDSKATLTTSLQHQSLLEYPTIYVLNSKTGALPPGFKLEQDYIKTAPRRPQVDTLPSSERSSRSDDVNDRHESQTGAVDAESILEMLKRDVRI